MCVNIEGRVINKLSWNEWYLQFTFPGLLGWAAHELDAAEDIDAAWEEHGEGAELHAAVSAGAARGRVPLVEVPAFCLVMNVVKQAMLGYQEGVRLEGALWKLLVGVSEVSRLG